MSQIESQLTEGSQTGTRDGATPLPVQEEESHPSIAIDAIPRRQARQPRLKKEKGRTPPEKKDISISIHMSQEDLELIGRYAQWLSLFGARTSKSSFLLSCGKEAIRKDKAFQEFMRANGLD